MMQILYSSNSFSFASEVMKYLDSNFSLMSSSCRSFSQQEKLVILSDHIENDIIIISSIKNNDDLMETLSIVDAAIRSGARNIVLVAPYLAYSRQDKMIPPYSSIGSEIVISLLKFVGVNKITIPPLGRDGLQGISGIPCVSHHCTSPYLP